MSRQRGRNLARSYVFPRPASSPGIVLGLALALVPTVGWADAVALKNPSFDSDEKVTEGGWTKDTPGWNQVQASRGAVGVWYPKSGQTGCGSPDHFIKDIPDGKRIAYSNGGELVQETGAQLKNGYKYTLTVGVGGRCNIADGKFALRLLAGSTQLAATTGTTTKGKWTDVTVTYTETGAHAGKALSIALENDGRTQVNFDHVRLDASKVFQHGDKLKTVLLRNQSIPGLDDLPVSAFKQTATEATATVTLRGKTAAVSRFKAGGTTMYAVVPKNFKLGDIVPLPGRTAADGMAFDDLAFIYVPKGHAQSRIAATAFPAAIAKAVKHFGANVSLREGFNLFGQADFNSASAIRKVLQAVGHTNMRLPLAAAFPADLFGADLRTASQKTKDQLLTSLTMDFPLPKLAIPGLPRTIAIEKARLAIVGREVKGKRKLFAGVTGGLNMAVAGKSHHFAFGMLAGDPGKQWQATITAESKDKISLPFFRPLELTDLNLTATRKQSKWDVDVHGKTTLNRKPVEATLHHDSKEGNSVEIDADLRISDLAPGTEHVPGLTDVVFKKVVMFKGHVEVAGVIKGLETNVAAFKHAGKRYIAISNPKAIKISSLIPAAKGTPLDAAKFEHMTYVYAPTGGAAKGLKLSVLPPDIAEQAKFVVKDLDLKEGLNVLGHMAIEKSSKIGQLLDKVGLHKDGLPLIGTLSPKIFHPGSARQFKNEILDNLDFKADLPTLNLPGVAKVAKIKGTHLEIKGVKKGNAREIAVNVAGELDVKAGGQTVVFDYDVEIKKETGKPEEIHITGNTPPGKKLSVNLVEKFTLSDLNFDMKEVRGAWTWQISGKTEFRSKPLTVQYQSNQSLLIGTQMTLGEIAGHPDLPVLKDIKSNWVYILKNTVRVDMNIKGIRADLDLWKPNGASKYWAGFAMGDFSPDKLIPGTSNTPLKDATFKNLVFIQKPTTGSETVKRTDLPDEVGYHMQGNQDAVTLKKGLNVFGHLDVHPTGTLATLLSHAGISKLNLPLNGTIDPKALSKNASAAKDAILDNLDIKATLPLPSGFKMPGHVKLTPPGLEIKGVKKDGKREIDVSVAGEMDVEVQNQKVAFFYKVETKKQAGKPAQVHITGSTAKGKKVTVSFGQKFTLDSLSLDMTKEKGGWRTKVDAKSEFRSKPIDVTYQHENFDGKSILEIHTKMTLADIVGQPSLPGLDDIQITTVEVHDKFWRLILNFKGTYGYINIFKPEGASKRLIAVSVGPPTISPAKFIPGAANTPLKDVDFKGLAFVYAPKGTAGPLPRTQLPRDIGYRLRPEAVPGDIVLKDGLNVFGKLEVHPTGEVATLLKEVGLHDLSLPLNGAFSPKVFAKDISGAAIKNEILDHLDIKVDLPKLALPGLPSSVTFKSTHLEIKGKLPDGKRGLEVAVAGELDAKVHNETLKMDYSVVADKAAGGKTEISIKGQSEKGTKLTLDLVEKFTLTDIAVDMARKDGKWDAKVNATTALNNKPVEVTYTRYENRVPALTFNTKMTIAELIGQKGLPGLDDVELDTVMTRPGMWFLHATIKGQPTFFQIQKVPAGHLIAAYLYSMPLTNLIPGSENSPLKDAKFSNVVALYNPGKVAQAWEAGLRYDAYAWIAQSNKGNPVVRPGLNIFGHIDVHPTGELAGLLKKVGVTELKLPLNGGFSPKAFSKNISGAALKNAILDHLDINVNLPTPHIPEMSKYLTFSNGHLELKGKLPDGSHGIHLKVSGDAEVKVEDQDIAFDLEVDYDRTQGGSSSDLHVTGETTHKWTHPLGIQFLTLEDLKLDIRKRKQSGGASTYDVDLAAKTDIGSHSKLDVKVDVHEVNGKLEDATFELDGPLKLSEIPGVSEVPDAGKFEIDTIKISEHGIEAKTDFGKNKDLDVYLFTGSGWNFVLRQDHFAITEFVPPLNATPLKHIKLSEAAVVLSKDGLKGPLSSFSPIAQDALKDIYGANAAEIDVESGLSLVAAFEHKNAGGGLSGALKRLGLSEERVVLTGNVGGLFGGPVKLDVEVDLSAHSGAKNQPKWMKSKPGVEAVFSLIGTEPAPGQFDIEIGIGADIIASVHGTELDFTTKTALEFEDEKIDVKIVADLKDKKGWKHPFGIPGFTLYEVGFDLGIDEDGAIHLGFDGDIKVSGSEYKVAADADLLPEALGAPQDIAFVASADKVDMFFVEEIALAMLGAGFKLDIPSGILPEFKNVKFAFATPGAQDPDLNITGEGFALKGSMNWLEHEVGAMNLSVNPTSGITASGKIDDIKLGDVLDLKNNHFDLKAGVKSLPTVKLNADIDVLGLKDRVFVNFDKKGVIFKSSLGDGSAFKADVDFELTGVNLSAKKPGFKDADFYMKGDLHLDVGKFISGPAKDALDDIFNDLSTAFKAAENALKDARAKVNKLNGEINAERAKVRRERAAAEGRLRSAENRVNQLNSWINDDWGHYHHCHGWGKYACRAKWAIRIGGLKAARWGADEALRLAETLVAHFPIDLDPRVAGLIVARDAANVSLRVALEAVEGADLLDRFLKEATDAVTTELGKAVNLDIKKASFEGDLRGIATKDEPMLLGLDIAIYGVEFKENVAFKWKDIPYDVEQMGVMALHALERVVDDVLHWMPGSLKHKVHSHIGSKMDAKQAEAKRELAKYSKDFSAIAAAQKAQQDRLAAYNDAFMKARLAATTSPADHDTSETFSNEMLEVGHTGLCLTNVKGVVKQYSCMGHADQRWTTTLATAAGHPNPHKYYSISNPASGHCLAPEGKWVRVQQKFDNIAFPEMQYQGDGKLTVRKCEWSREFNWKVLKHGAGWLQLVNDATGACVHFKNDSSHPGAAEAEWAACVGSANQVFRVADSASPKFYKANFAMRNDSESTCFSNPTSKGLITPVPCAKAARYNYGIDIRGYVRMVNRETGHCLQPASSASGAELVERACTQRDIQWWNTFAVPGGCESSMPRPRCAFFRRTRL